MTVTLAPSVREQVRLVAAKERTEKYMEGLLAWLGEGGVGKIVLVKNCGARIREEVLVELAREFGKELEVVQVRESAKTAWRGKGYGEGDMIFQALEKSRILRGAESFLKVTGKLYCVGWEEIFSLEGDADFFLMEGGGHGGKWRRIVTGLYKSEAGSRLMGWLRRGRMPWPLIAAGGTGWLDTRFYRVRKPFYQECLLGSYRRVQDALAYHLENAFFDDTRGREGCCFHRDTPMILGTSGTLGTTSAGYPREIEERAKAIAQALWVE